MKQEILLGVTDRTVLVFIPDAASTDGSGKTGLVAANLTVSYVRVETDNDVVVTDVTGSLSDLSALTDAHSDWGLKEVSNTLAPGLYRLDIADAVFASGAWSAVVYVMVTTSAAAASPMEFILVATNHLDGVRMGLTALPNAAADAAGGLPISDAGALDLDARLDAAVSSRMATYVQPTGFLAATFPGTVASTTNITAGTITTVTTLTGHTPQTGDAYALANGVSGFVAIKGDTAAIKLKTDPLTYTVAGIADVNIQYVNDVQVNGTGAGGDEWGP